MHVYLYNVKYFESQYVNISYDTLVLLQQLNFSKIVVYFKYFLIAILCNNAKTNICFRLSGGVYILGSTSTFSSRVTLIFYADRTFS